MPAPYEIYANGQMSVYLAAPNTADPAINVNPTGVGFTLLGVSGSQDYGEDGIAVGKATENNPFYALGSLGTRKVFRNRETLTIGLTLVDATIEAISAVLNQNTITTVVGPPAEKKISLLEGVATPTFRAMLIKGSLSPYMDGGTFQWWIPIVYQTGTLEWLFKKADPIGVKAVFTAVADATNGFGLVHAQTS
jgi:hypothetical protein